MNYAREHLMNDTDMNRGQRVARIVALLMKHKRMQASDLASHFGVSTRSIYRDMRDIVDAGLPVLGISGDGYLWKPPPGATQ
jgi:predicted DNA-binding transcriptional regulator YafY